MRGFIEELRRRNVFHVGVAYVVTGWLIVQVADIAADARLVNADADHRIDSVPVRLYCRFSFCPKFSPGAHLVPTSTRH